MVARKSKSEKNKILLFMVEGFCHHHMFISFRLFSLFLIGVLAWKWCRKGVMILCDVTYCTYFSLFCFVWVVAVCLHLHRICNETKTVTSFPPITPKCCHRRVFSGLNISVGQEFQAEAIKPPEESLSSSSSHLYLESLSLSLLMPRRIRS